MSILEACKSNICFLTCNRYLQGSKILLFSSMVPPKVGGFVQQL